MTKNDHLPVQVIYDRDKVDENSNIEQVLVVPLSTARTRSNNDHEIGRRLFMQAKKDEEELLQGKYRGIPLEVWKKRAPNYIVPTLAEVRSKLRTLKIEDPDAKPTDQTENHIDGHVRNALRLSAGIKGFRSNQATQSLSAQGRPMVHGEGSLTPVTNQPAPQTTVQIAVGAAKDASGPAKNGFKKLVGWNGR